MLKNQFETSSKILVEELRISEKRSTSYLMQVIGMAIQRGNSAYILETVTDFRKLDEVYYL